MPAGRSMIVIVAVAGLALASCSDGSGTALATAPVSTSSAPTTTSSPPPSAIAMAPPFSPVPPQELPPQPAPERTPESAEAFLQWWIAVLNRVELTGEIDLIRQNSDSKCKFCNGRIATVEQFSATGDRLERAGVTEISNLRPTDVDANGYIVIQFDVTTPPSRIIDAAGTEIGSTPATLAQPLLAGIQWDETRWVMLEIATGESG